MCTISNLKILNIFFFKETSIPKKKTFANLVQTQKIKSSHSFKFKMSIPNNILDRLKI